MIPIKERNSKYELFGEIFQTFKVFDYFLKHANPISISIQGILTLIKPPKEAFI